MIQRKCICLRFISEPILTPDRVNRTLLDHQEKYAKISNFCMFLSQGKMVRFFSNVARRVFFPSSYVIGGCGEESGPTRRSFCFACACTWSACKMEMHFKYHAQVFPFPFWPRDALLFLSPPITKNAFVKSTAYAFVIIVPKVRNLSCTT